MLIKMLFFYFEFWDVVMQQFVDVVFVFENGDGVICLGELLGGG